MSVDAGFPRLWDVKKKKIDAFTAVVVMLPYRLFYLMRLKAQ